MLDHYYNYSVEDDFVETFSDPEARESIMFRLFVGGNDIAGIDREAPRIRALIELYMKEHEDVSE